VTKSPWKYWQSCEMKYEHQARLYYNHLRHAEIRYHTHYYNYNKVVPLAKYVVCNKRQALKTCINCKAWQCALNLQLLPFDKEGSVNINLYAFVLVKNDHLVTEKNMYMYLTTETIQEQLIWSELHQIMSSYDF
jgi:hypothetical protein